MNKKQKNVVKGAALFSLAITAGIATAQYRANIPMKSGKFDLVAGQKNQNGAGELKEPAQENGGRDKAAKGLTPGQSIAKNPYIVSKADPDKLTSLSPKQKRSHHHGVAFLLKTNKTNQGKRWYTSNT